MVLLNRLLKKVSLNRQTCPHAPSSNEKLQIAVQTETNDPVKELLRMCYYMSYPLLPVGLKGFAAKIWVPDSAGSFRDLNTLFWLSSAI